MSQEHYDVIIAGAGLSGLATASFINRISPEKSVLILEKADRVGGAIRSMNEHGYLGEWGPHGFLDNVPETKELLADLDFGDDMQKASLKRFLRYICQDGKLKQIPQTPPKIIKSDLMSLPAKIRVLGDFLKKPKMEEMSVTQWITHRFGKSFLPFADIVMTGTYAGDIDKLSIDSVWPGFRNLEATHGSVFKGVLKQQKQKKAQSAGKTREFPSMVSFKGGMEEWVIKLAERKNIRLNSAVNMIKQLDKGWQVEAGDQQYTTDNLVLALQINQSLQLLDTITPAPQKSVEEAIVLNIFMGFDSSADIPFGFGFLTPRDENRFALGAMFPTHMFPGRAPRINQTLEVLVGGRRNPERLDLSDADLINAAIKDMRDLIKLPRDPEFVKVLRPSVGIPQLNIGHKALQDYRDQMEITHQGLNVCGFGWEGIGTNDMVKMAKRTAQNIERGKPEPKETAKAKKIYV